MLKHTGGEREELLTIYSIVNSLCKLDQIDRVQFLVEGKSWIPIRIICSSKRRLPQLTVSEDLRRNKRRTEMKRPILWTTIFMICGIYMRLGISKVICLVSFLSALFLFRFVINKKKPAYLLLLFFVPLGFFSAGVHWQAEQSL